MSNLQIPTSIENMADMREFIESLLPPESLCNFLGTFAVSIEWKDWLQRIREVRATLNQPAEAEPRQGALLDVAVKRTGGY